MFKASLLTVDIKRRIPAQNSPNATLLGSFHHKPAITVIQPYRGNTAGGGCGIEDSPPAIVGSPYAGSSETGRPACASPDVDLVAPSPSPCISTASLGPLSILWPSYGGGASPSSFRPSSARTTPVLLGAGFGCPCLLGRVALLCASRSSSLSSM